MNKELGSNRDEKKALEYYLKAAEGGDLRCPIPDGFHLFGRIVGSGEGMSSKAVEWFEKAAEYHHIDSIYNLGFLI